MLLQVYKKHIIVREFQKKKFRYSKNLIRIIKIKKRKVKMHKK